MLSVRGMQCLAGWSASDSYSNIKVYVCVHLGENVFGVSFFVHQFPFWRHSFHDLQRKVTEWFVLSATVTLQKEDVWMYE